MGAGGDVPGIGSRPRSRCSIPESGGGPAGLLVMHPRPRSDATKNPRRERSSALRIVASRQRRSMKDDKAESMSMG
jgi:hypothetical protein